LPGLTRQSILLAKKMDTRVEPAYDGGEMERLKLEMIDHISIGVRDLEKARRFYAAVLATLGFTQLREWPTAVGYGKKYPEFWINHRPDLVVSDTGVHVCLRAPSTDAVDAFHAAALRAGASSDGAPGPRHEYVAGYYAAFIRDADGNRIEAITFVEGKR
jgi:catechol 2,3-dioxygenase-like lactoylglutathione lyase family enzyme